MKQAPSNQLSTLEAVGTHLDINLDTLPVYLLLNVRRQSKQIKYIILKSQAFIFVCLGASASNKCNIKHQGMR